jgi:hypothetical protein
MLMCCYSVNNNSTLYLIRNLLALGRRATGERSKDIYFAHVALKLNGYNLPLCGKFVTFKSMILPGNRRERVALLKRRMQKAMPEVRRQIRVYEKALENGTLVPIPKNTRSFTNVSS